MATIVWILGVVLVCVGHDQGPWRNSALVVGIGLMIVSKNRREGDSR